MFDVPALPRLCAAPRGAVMTVVQQCQKELQAGVTSSCRYRKHLIHRWASINPLTT